MRELFIKILFYLLKVRFKTKDLLLFEDINRLKDPEESQELIREIQLKYNRTLSVVYSTPHFIEWIYLQILTKQREHIMTQDKEKKTHQVASIIFLLWLIEEMKRADKELLILNKKAKRKA